jgi:1,4-alpha-glucan branching enzyme
VLGPRLETSQGGMLLTVRAYLPRATEAWVKIEGRSVAMREEGNKVYEARIEAPESFSKMYTVCFVDRSGYVEEREDPYSFGPYLSDYDLYLIGEGTHHRSFEKLGAHLLTREGVEGVQFAVWAPNARSVSVVGDFNHWMPGAHPMSERRESGIWELFVPRLTAGELYKFAIRTRSDDRVLLKTDPYAFRAQLRPDTAAVVSDLSGYAWGDGSWMEARAKGKTLEGPISIYEVHLGSWKNRSGSSYPTYRELADEVIPHIKGLGFTHVELMPIMEHPLDDSWGYQVVNYYAPTSRFGKPEDFMYLVDKCHQNGIGVILDWVPGHFPKDEHGIASFDGTHLYEHEDPRKGVHPEWGTLIFNYSRNEVRTFLISNAIFWLETFHADGLRLDAVASMLYLDYARRPGDWVPNEFGGKENLEAIRFLKQMNDAVHSSVPGAITIAEESTAWMGVTRPTRESGLGFDMKWNMGWMHDTLEYFSRDPVYRRFHQGSLTFNLWYAFSERFVLVYSHDEVVYGKRSMLSKMPGDDWRRFANLRLCYGYMFTHPGKKLLFMGGEFGQWDEWDFRRGLDWHLAQQGRHRGLMLFIRDLNLLYQECKQLNELDFSPQGFEWVDFKDADNNVITFIRKAKDGSFVLVALNLSPVPRFNYRVGTPSAGRYEEVFNSDAVEYGGSGVGNLGSAESVAIPWNGRQFSLSLTLPPLGMLVFVPERRA